MRFEWDRAKAAVNADKHEVTFSEASTVFEDPLSLTVADPDHSVDESRLITFGVSASGTALVVAHTESGDTIRIISARPMTRRERQAYES